MSDLTENQQEKLSRLKNKLESIEHSMKSDIQNLEQKKKMIQKY